MFLQYVLLQMKRPLLTRETFLQLKSEETYRRGTVTKSLQVTFASKLPIPTETLALVINIQDVKILAKQAAKSALNHLKCDSLILMYPRPVSYHYHLSPQSPGH